MTNRTEATQPGFLASVARTAGYGLLVYGIAYVAIGAIEFAVTGNITATTSTAASILGLLAVITN